jgi:hypothetical protein
MRLQRSQTGSCASYSCEYLHVPSPPHRIVGGPRRQRLRQGCQKLSATVSLRGEGGVNSTRVGVDQGSEESVIKAY